MYSSFQVRKNYFLSVEIDQNNEVSHFSKEFFRIFWLFWKVLIGKRRCLLNKHRKLNFVNHVLSLVKITLFHPTTMAH